MSTYAPFQTGMTTGGTWTYVGTPSPNPAPPATYDAAIDFAGFAAGLYTYRYTVTNGSDTHSIDVIIEWQGDGTAPSNDVCAGSRFISGFVSCPVSASETFDTSKPCAVLVAAPTDSGVALPAQWTLPSYTGDLWYRINPPSCVDSYQLTVSLSGAGNGNDAQGVAVAVYSNNCSSLVLQEAETGNSNATSVDVTVTVPANVTGSYYIRVASGTAGAGIVTVECTGTCEASGTTTLLYFTSYVDDDDASNGGVGLCMAYRLSQVNNYGGISPGGRVLYLTRIGGCTSYADDAAAAAAGVGLGEMYAISQVNNYGLASPGGRLAVVRTDGGSVSTFKGPFTNDTSAALGGVAIGEPYLAAPVNDYNSPSGVGRTLLVRLS